ncbi:MAG TPA: RNA polymerase Rpb4 [Candidatus Altiarchaeales archaeon]|nr:RNA polymerase Rpb4 [Candidatus Altiarchaeales archaeon]
MEILETRPAALSEVAEILAEKEKAYSEKGLELLYEQKKALEHARRFEKLPVKQCRELEEKLLGLELNMTPERAVKIVDLLPKTVDDVRAIFAKERFKYSEEEISKIIDLVAQYR